VNCVITIEGKKGRQGWTTNTKTGPVKNFIKDLEAYYRGIYEHCLKCPICDPNEILLAFLKNRDARHNGLTSDLIIKMALKYEQNVKNVKREIVNDYVARAASTNIIINHSNRFTRNELLAAFKQSQLIGVFITPPGSPWIINMDNFEPKNFKHFNLIKGIICVIQSLGSIPDDDYEFDKLVGIAEVMDA